MLTRNRAHSIVATIGNVISYCIFISSGPTFTRFPIKMDIKDRKPRSYLCSVFSCLFWTFYGLPFVSKGNMLLSIIHFVGLVTELYSFTIFLLNVADKKKRLPILGLLVGELLYFMVVAGAMLTLDFESGQRERLVGIICIFFSIMFYTYPLSFWLKQTLRNQYFPEEMVVTTTKDEEEYDVPIWSPLAGVAKTCIWTYYYSGVRYNSNIWVCCSLDDLFAMIAMILYVYESSTSTPKIRRSNSGRKAKACCWCNSGVNQIYEYDLV